MSELEEPVVDDGVMDPSMVSDRTFATAFRGFDPVQVRSFLGEVADELRRLQQSELALRALVQTEGDAPSQDTGDQAGAPASDPGTGKGDDGREAEESAASVVAAAQAEAERLVREAKERVATLGGAATSESTRLLEEARAEAVRIRATATDALKGRSEEAEATAVRKIAEAEREAAAIRVRAREEADAVLEAARDRGREMVAEAQAARERMLADLAKRKRAAQAQLEQLRAGRDRLLDTLKVARRSIDEMTTRFDASDGGAAGSLTPPSSGTPAGSVSTTLGATNTEARPRIAAAAGSPVGSASGDAAPPNPRPIRSRAVAIGEVPPSAARPQIAAQQAGETLEPVRVGPAPAPVPQVPSAQAASAAPPVPEATPQVAPPTEERRSSALRILRRSKAPEPTNPPAPPIGRDSHGEGVRIIGRPGGSPAPSEPTLSLPIEPPPEPEPEREPVPEPEPEPVVELEVERSMVEAPLPQVDPELDAPGSEPEAAVEPTTAVRPEPEPDHRTEVAPAEALPAPLLQEEIRPRIEDLFARIRADREATTADARQVLGMDQPPVGDDAAGSGSADVPAESEAGAESPAPAPAAVAPLTDVDENSLQHRDAAVDPLASQLTKRLKRALQDEQNASLDRLRTSRGRAQVDQILSRPDDQASPYRHLALAFLEQAALAGASSSPFGPVALPVEDLAVQLADDLAGALRSRLDGVLSTGASDDVDLATMSERISAVYREWKVSKVERLGVHYLVAAHERGGFLAHPEGTPLRWLVDDDGPCPDCEDNALAGPTPRGQAFPTGQLHPPAHLGCRCLLVATPT